MNAERADTIARIPTASLAPPADEGPIPEVKEEPKGQAPSDGNERRGPDGPRWTKRLRPPPSPQSRTAPAPTRDAEGVIPPWLNELRGPADEEDGNCGPGYESNEDWLARLRQAAIIQQESANEEPAAIIEETEPLPIPKWFAQIRPPVPAKPPEPALAQGPVEPLPGEGATVLAPTETKHDERQQVAEHPAGPSPDGEALPEWLVQLQSLPLPREQEPGVAPYVEQYAASTLPGEAASSGGEGTSEPSAFLAQEASEAGPTATVQVAHAPAEPASPSAPQIAAPEQVETSELPLTREEELGLPDWLAYPIEPGTRLPKIEGMQESEAEAEWTEFLARESEANRAALPERGEAGDARAPLSLLARIAVGIQDRLHKLGRPRFRPQEQDGPPANTTLIKPADAAGRIVAHLTQQETVQQAPEETSPRLSDELPEWLTKMPEFEATIGPTLTRPPPNGEHPEHEEFVNPQTGPSKVAGTESTFAETEAQDSDGIATWPLAEDFAPGMPFVPDEILHSPEPVHPQIAQGQMESTAAPPTNGRDVADLPIGDREILGLSIPPQPAAEESAPR